MNQKDFKRRIKLLSDFCNKKYKNIDMNECNNLTIHGICELCFNILRKEKEIPLNKRTLKRLKPLRGDLHYLADNRKKSIKRKKEIIKDLINHTDFFRVVKKSIIPALNKLYTHNIQLSI